MNCAQLLNDGFAAREPIALADVVEEAALMKRVDKKFLLSRDQLAEFLNRIGPEFRAMEIAGRRVFGYSSTYFDTEDLDQFRAHRQGRRRRFKVRTRTYLDSGLCMFEAKLKGPRGETDKHRIKHPLDLRKQLTADADIFLAELLDEHYGMAVPDLVPVMTTDYQRGTLVNPHSSERITLDVSLVCMDAARTEYGPDMVILETKSADGRGAADQLLAAMGIRELSISKYCVGIAMLHPYLPANKWHRVLRQHFSWSREQKPAPAIQPAPVRSATHAQNTFDGGRQLPSGRHQSLGSDVMAGAEAQSGLGDGAFDPHSGEDGGRLVGAGSAGRA